MFQVFQVLLGLLGSKIFSNVFSYIFLTQKTALQSFPSTQTNDLGMWAKNAFVPICSTAARVKCIQDAQ